MLNPDPYVDPLLDAYRRLPGTLHRVLRNDRRTARFLRDRHIGLDVVHQAFVLALARRNLRSPPQNLPPIRCLRYFLPVIQEIVDSPPDPDYLRYLERQLLDLGVDPPP